jgi:hypothetical protein
MGVDSLNLSPDVYNSHRYSTIARAVEKSKRYQGFSKSVGHQPLNVGQKSIGPQEPYAGALLHNTVEGETLPDKWGNPCASSFKSGTQRFKCTHGISQGLHYEPDVGPKASIVAGVRASPMKFSGFNSPTARFVYPVPSNYPDINPDVGPNASIAVAMQVQPHTMLHHRVLFDLRQFVDLLRGFQIGRLTVHRSGIQVQLLFFALKCTAMGLPKATGSSEANNSGA